MKKRIFGILLAAVMCASMLAACSSGTKETASGESAVSGSAADGNEDEKTLRIAFPDTVTTVDVANITSATMLKEVAGVCETLVHADEDFTLQPNLATEWRMTGDNTWEFKLRDDVLFHDGGLVYLAVEKFVLHIIKPEPCNGIGKAFARNALVAEEQDRLFHDLDDFLFRREDAGKRAAFRHLFAPSSADVDLIPVRSFVVGVERAFRDTAPAVVAHALVDDQFSVLDGCGVHGAGLFYLAHFTAAALGKIGFGNALSDHAQIVEVRLDAVVRAAAHRKLELVRQSDVVIPFIEELVQLFAERESIDQAVLAGRTLARDYRTNF